MTQYAQMPTETLRLLLSQRRLVQSGPRQQLIARLQANDSQDSTSPPTGPATMPDQQLASMIASIVEQKLATLNSASNSLSSSTSGVVQPSTQRSATFSGRYKPRTRSLSPTGPQWRTTTDSVLSEFLAVQLYLDTFTGVPKAILCKACSSSDHVTDSCPLSPRSTDSLGPKRGDLCFNFNKGVPCARTPCPYTHQCNKPGCTAAHPQRTTLTPQALDPPSQRLAAQAIHPKPQLNTFLSCPLPPLLTFPNLPFICMITLTVHPLMLSLLASPRVLKLVSRVLGFLRNTPTSFLPGKIHIS